MKLQWKRIAALSLAGAMCLSLFGCGDKEGKQKEEKKTLAQELGYGYLSEYSKLETEMEYVQNVSAAQGKLYIHGYYYDEENYESSGDRLYTMDLASGETTQIPIPELLNTDNSSENIQAISVCADGSAYWMITNTYTYEAYPEASGDLPEVEAVPAEGETATPETVPAEGETADPEGEQPETDAGLAAEYHVELLSNEVPLAEDAAADATDAETVEEAPAAEGTEAVGGGGVAIMEDGTATTIDDSVSNNEGSYQEPQQTYTAKKCDINGNVLMEIDLSEAVADMDWFYCQYMVQNAEGDLLIASDTVILCYGSDGTRKADIAVDTYYIQSMVATGDGTVLISYYNTENNGMEVCRVENGGLSAPLEIKDINENGSIMMYPGDGGKVLLSDGKKLYEMDAASGETTTLLSWLDSDVNGNRIRGLTASGEDTLLVMLERYTRTGSNTYELGTLTKTPADQIPERTILTLGAVYLDDNIQNAVIDFNRKSDTYRITLVDYSTYNTEEDYTLGAKQLDMDVISGNSPDLISLDSGNVQKYMNKGVLANLTELMDKDGEISMDQLLTGPLQAYTQDGKLYGMPYSFGITTLYGSAKLLGDRESWTLEDMAQVIDGLPEETTVMNYTTQADFLSNMVYRNMSRFVDYGKAECFFDGDEFKSLMEVSAKLPEDYNYGESEDGVAYAVSSGDEMEMLQTGDALLSSGWLSSSYELKNFYNLYIKENGIVKIGYPSDSGNGATLNVYGGLAIADKCANKDGAWAFVKTVLSDDFQNEQWNLPVTVSAMDKILAEAMEKEYYMDGDEKVYVDSVGYIGNTEYPMKELTQEQADSFKDYVNGATVVGNYDSDIMEIVTEEAAAYFAGDKTADEVAKLIQNRVSIYLGETS